MAEKKSLLERVREIMMKPFRRKAPAGTKPTKATRAKNREGSPQASGPEQPADKRAGVPPGHRTKGGKAKRRK